MKDKSFLVQFESGKALCVLAANPDEARDIAAKTRGQRATLVQILPHPALPYAGRPPMKLGALCRRPAECAGSTSCRKSPSCDGSKNEERKGYEDPSIGR